MARVSCRLVGRGARCRPIGDTNRAAWPAHSRAFRRAPCPQWIADIHFIVLDCPDDLRRQRIEARPSWRHRDIEEQTEFTRWLRANVADRVDTSAAAPEESAAERATWVLAHLSDNPGRSGAH